MLKNATGSDHELENLMIPRFTQVPAPILKRPDGVALSAETGMCASSGDVSTWCNDQADDND